MSLKNFKIAFGQNYRFTLALKGKKKRLVMNFQFIFAFSETNFRIAEQTLNFDFKNAWKILENFNLSARSAEAANPKNFDFEKLRYLLDEIRTFFEKNPDCEF